jgi:hypothetical protein
MRRTIITAVAAALVLGLTWTAVLSSAGAQPATDVFVVGDIPVTPANGFATMLLGSDDGVISIHCDGGSGPGRALGGPVVPAIVLDRLDPDATRLRITSWGTNTPAVNGAQVFIGCTFEATTGSAAVTKIRQLHSNPRTLVRSGW